MIFDQHFLLASIPKTTDKSSAIATLISQIKQNQFERVGSSVLHFLNDPLLQLPLAVSEDSKSETKWEKFAGKKGIVKRKKPFFVVDEETNETTHSYGSMSKKNLEMRSGIFKDGISYSKMKRMKNERVAKNKEMMEKNKQRNEKPNK